jgi:cation:H+ antiporter
MNTWIGFTICAAVILTAGNRLSVCSELIAEKSGMSKSLAGLLLLAMVTSSSQLFASVSAVVLHDLPDLAVSGLIGSSMFNMMLIGLLDLTSRDKPVSNVIHNGHILTVGFGIILMGAVAVDILFGKHLPVITAVRNTDPITLAIVPIYLLAMKITFRHERARLSEACESASSPDETNLAKSSWPRLLTEFAICAVCIVAASCYLPALAEQIHASTGWGENFIGSSFIAITTCLPELAVSVSAARRGSFDMAVASLLGSNLCYIVILSIADFCYSKEPLLRHVSQMNLLTALSAIISMGIVVVALTYRSEKKFAFIAGDALALIAVYVFANILLFKAH